MLILLNYLVPNQQLEPKSVELYGQLVRWKYVLLAAINKYFDFHGSLFFGFGRPYAAMLCYCPLLVIKTAQ